MLSKFNRLIVFLIVLAIALYVVLINDVATTIYLVPSSPLTANTGIILICAFVLGILFMAVVALWFGMKSYFRERGLRARDKQRQAFYETMLKARSLLSSGEWNKARETWEQALKKDPTDIIARIELSRTIEGLAAEGKSELLEALRVLDAARAADPKNVEVLFRAAEINLALNNKTAALDNLNLVMYHAPGKKAALIARNLAEELGRIDDAFEYQRQLETLSADLRDHDHVMARLGYKKLLKESGNDTEKLRDRLRDFSKKHPSYAPALVRLAEVESDAGKLDNAAQLYVKASKLPESDGAWHSAAKLWLKANLPEKAIAAAKLATTQTSGEARINAELELIRLYVALNMLDEGRKLIDGFPFLLKREGVTKSREIMTLYLSLKGLCLARMGEHHLSSEIFKKLCEQEPELQDFVKEVANPQAKEPPAPRLSTP